MAEEAPSTPNPQSGSNASTTSSGDGDGSSKSKKKYKALPPLFWYMEMGDWNKATERAKRHPREVKTWATLRTKSQANESISGTKRLALHHACFKLRSVVPSGTASTGSGTRSSSVDDNFVEVCKFILLLAKMYPEACGMRESRHGCLPLHLAAFASCAPRHKDEANTEVTEDQDAAAGLGTPSAKAQQPSSSLLPKPNMINRSISDNTTNSHYSNAMSAMMAEEMFSGAQSRAFNKRSFTTQPGTQPNVSVSLSKSNILISARREDMAVKVINALLDAYPKAIKVDSEGGRLPLHTACAGRATPRVISTLVGAYPAAARHRNKDGFLPLHLAAHWGVSHPNVAITLLKAYPDSSLGRNRWERTPLEEALSMAGENGRPHQAALVRALRKHPSYWAKPVEELFRSTTLNTRIESTIVDMDETIADDETSAVEDENNHNAAGAGAIPFHNSPVYADRRSEAERHSLQALIRSQNWGGVLERLQVYPHEAGEALINCTTRGGFIAANGCLPLHYACERRPPVEAVQALLEAWPEAATTRMQPGGALPLHISCTWHSSAGVVGTLIQTEKATCKVTDELGNLPIHHAAFSGAIVPVVDVLLRAYPKGVLARNHQGSLPSDITRRLRHDNRKNTLTLLEVRKEEVMSAHHRRVRSAGSSVAGMAERASQLNMRDGGPPRSPKDRSNLKSSSGEGVEVTYEEVMEGQGEMLWI